MSVRNIVMAAAGAAGGAPPAVEDVFAASLYTGNGAGQTITNGIDLAGRGGLVWLKARGSTSFNNHALWDSARLGTGSQTFGAYVSSNTTAAEVQYPDGFSHPSPSGTGFSFPSGGSFLNNSGITYASWTFRKAPKFFDVVTYTGDGTASKNVSHALGVKPGAMLIKSTSNTEAWGSFVLAANGNYHSVTLNTTAADPFVTPAFVPASTTTSSDFNVAELASYSASGQGNTSGQTYVAYLFAHDTAPEGIVQCGSFATDGSGNGSFNHGWAEGAQFVMLKASSNTGDWEMFDKSRTPSWSGADARLRANLAGAEDTVFRLSESGTTLSFAGLSASTTYSFITIRSPA